MAITVVQSKVIANALSGSFSNPTTAGNCVIVAVSAYSTSGTPSVSGVTLGGAAGNFGQAVSVANTGSTEILSAIWADPGCAGGQTAVAVSGSSLTVNSSFGITIMEVSGLATSAVVDKTSSGSGTTGTSWSSGATGTTTAASEIWVGAAGGNGTTVTFPGSPWTSSQYGTAGGGSGYQIVSSTGAATYAGTQNQSVQWSACVATFLGVTAISEADEAAALDQITAQVTSIPVVLITAPRRPSGPPPPPIRAQILTVPTGTASPQDVAAASEALTVGTVPVPLADAGGAADTISAGIYPADAAGAAEALAITAVSLPVGDVAGSADTLTAAVQLSTYDNAASIDLGQTTGLTQSDTAAAADKLTAAVTVTLADRAGAVEAIGTEPAIGASGGATRPAAVPGTSQVAVAAPGSSNWVYLGSIGQVTALKYSFTCPGGADSMTCTVMVPASYRNQAFSPGWQVRVTRGGHQVWRGKMDEPVPTASGWNFTAVGNGMRGTDYLAIYTDTWPTGQPDESINGAISRGLPWVNPGVGTPAGAWFGQGVDSGAQTITALLNLVTTRGAMTWYVNSQPGGMPGDDLSVFPLPTVPNRLLIATTPVPRTLGADINTIYIRYEITADNTDATTSTTAPATYGLTVAQNAASVAMHGELETYIDISDVGVMSAGAAQAVGQNVLALYQRASFGGPFTGNYGALMNMGGVPVDPGTDQAGTVVRLILTDFGYGGELVPGPIQFIVGSYEWDDFAQAFTLSAMNTLDHSLTGMLQMTNTTLTPITVAST